MKLYRKLLLILTGLFFMVSMSAFADQPPDPGGGPGSGDDPVGGGAPIGGGLIVMLIMGTVYGVGKTFYLKNKKS